MAHVTLYHNPRCSKSRAALSLLQERGAEVHVIEYLKNPPDEEALHQLVAMLEIAPRALLRTNEAPFRELHLEDDSLDDAEILHAIAANPILMQRPIAVTGERAVIGRPPERVLELL